MTPTFSLYVALLFLAAAISSFRFKMLSSAEKCIAILLCLTFVAEVIAKIFSFYFSNNLIVYKVFTPIQFLLLMLFFVRLLRGTVIERFSFITSVIALIVGSMLLFHIPQEDFSTSLLIFEGVYTIAFSLITLTSLFRQRKTFVKFNSVFWICMTLVFFWTISVLWFGSYNVIVDMSLFDRYFQIFFWTNCLTYLSFSLIFFFYSKLNTYDD